MSGRLWRRLRKLLIYKHVLFTHGLQMAVGPFSKSCLQPDLAHLGVALAGSAVRAKALTAVVTPFP